MLEGLETSDEYTEVDTKSTGESGHGGQGGVAMPGFQAADVGAVDPSFQSEGLLGPAVVQTVLTHASTELNLQRGGRSSGACHEAKAGRPPCPGRPNRGNISRLGGVVVLPGGGTGDGRTP